MTDEAAAFELRPVDPSLAGPFPVDSKVRARIGRDPSSDIVLPYPTVSRRHAEVFQERGVWYIADVGSRHGTTVNGMAIEAGQPIEIQPRDRIGFPRQEYRLHPVGGGAAADEASSTIVALAGDAASQNDVEAVSQDALSEIAAKRLDLLLEGAKQLGEAVDREALVEHLLDLLESGTGFGRFAVLQPIGGEDRIEVVSVRPPAIADDRPFSRTLVSASMAGSVVRLAEDEDISHAHSIVTSGVQSAVAVPMMVDGDVQLIVYLDATRDAADADEDTAFCAAVTRLAGLSLANIHRQELARRQEALEREIKAARGVQERMLPPESGEVGVYRYALKALPGTVVAGDLFGTLDVAGAQTAFYLGDVAGKGAAAGMLMALGQAALEAHLDDGLPLATAVDKVNDAISARSSMGEFLTLFAITCDPAQQSVCTVDAGHGYAFLLRDGEWKMLESDGGPPIGAVPGIEFGTSKHDFKPGERLVLMSDGVIEETEANSDDQFGVERTIEILEGSDDPENDVARLVDALVAYAGRDTFADDVTVASIEFVASNGD